MIEFEERNLNQYRPIQPHHSNNASYPPLLYTDACCGGSSSNKRGYSCRANKYGGCGGNRQQGNRLPDQNHCQHQQCAKSSPWDPSLVFV